MNKLSGIETELHISLPDIYRHFYDLCSISMPQNLIGTDLWNNSRFDLNEAAAELLNENGIDNFLESDNFVFMMHKGYIFWYFKANGDTDPIVYGYREGKLKPDNLGHFSDLAREYK